jgi:hypothetical protein
LRAALEEIFYTVDVTFSELWKSVGKTLKAKRIDREWRPIDVERAGGPSYKTVQAIERGQAGNVESFDRYARALNLSIVDIIYGVMAPDTALSPEAAHVVRIFSQTTVEGRTAMLAMVNALPAAAPAAVPAGGGAPPKPDRSRGGLPVPGRRTVR